MAGNLVPRKALLRAVWTVNEMLAINTTTLLEYHKDRESIGLSSVILTRPLWVFLSFSTSISTVTLSKTAIVVLPEEDGEGTVIV